GRGAPRGARARAHGRAREHPRRAREPQGHRDREGRRASPRDRDPGAPGARGAARRARLPRALRARRAGLGDEPAPPAGARAVNDARLPDPAASAGGLPVVALVGRPNVGKSTLFNRLVRARRAIVDDVPGVTRDRLVAPATHAGREFLCVDTGGVTSAPARDALAAGVRAQTLAAIAEADVVVVVVDGVAGLEPEDRETIRLVRRSGKPMLLAVNKLDRPGRDALAHDFLREGLEPLAVSAAHHRGVEALLDA